MMAWVLDLDFAGSNGTTVAATVAPSSTFLLLGACLSLFILFGV